MGDSLDDCRLRFLQMCRRPPKKNHLTHRLTEDGTVCGTGDKVGARVSMVPE